MFYLEAVADKSAVTCASVGSFHTAGKRERLTENSTGGMHTETRFVAILLDREETGNGKDKSR